MKYTTQDIEYTIKESRFGLFTSVQTDGTQMVTALTADACKTCTDLIHIPCLKGNFKGWTSQARVSAAIDL
jgi:hypothetical protein